tara:strand:+ start:847 stop:996 length:150 start_codon:yes stop_codon:yes gene_type:complete
MVFHTRHVDKIFLDFFNQLKKSCDQRNPYAPSAGKHVAGSRESNINSPL